MTRVTFHCSKSQRKYCVIWAVFCSNLILESSNVTKGVTNKLPSLNICKLVRTIYLLNWTIADICKFVYFGHSFLFKQVKLMFNLFCTANKCSLRRLAVQISGNVLTISLVFTVKLTKWQAYWLPYSFYFPKEKMAVTL